VELGSLVEIEGFPSDFSRIFIGTHFELIKKPDVSGVYIRLRKDERKVQTDFFFLSVNLRAIANCMRQRFQRLGAGGTFDTFLRCIRKIVKSDC
jgi:hypothetical protein